jgi:hypothetical protein
MPVKPRTFSRETDAFVFEVFYEDKGPFAVSEQQEESALPPEGLAKVQALRAELKQLEDTAPPEPDMACAVQEGERVEQTVFIRGDYNSPGEPAPKAFPAIVAGEQQPLVKSVSGRLELANWIGSPGNPLTARVMVNRIWAHHFGKGLVSTASNFGRLGQQPTHPELLDWLAVKFRESGWSVKAMHRLIMSSRTYQMSSIAETEKNSADPRNRFLWKFPQRRLEAEIIRDIVLDAAGTLNEEMGGEPFFPSLPESVWRSFGKGKWDLTVEGPDNWRRSVYSYWKRGLKFPLFEVLDQPDPSITCERRNVSTVPTQALTLLNNPFILGQAGLFAQRVAEEAGAATETRIRKAYQIALSRAPTERELSRNVSFVERQRADHLGRGSADADLDALVDLCDVILNLNEFVYLN